MKNYAHDKNEYSIDSLQAIEFEFEFEYCQIN